MPGNVDLLVQGYFTTLLKASAEMWLNTKALEILARKHYGDQEYKQALEEANRIRPSWTVAVPK
jgi:hypothetical protein